MFLAIVVALLVVAFIALYWHSHAFRDAFYQTGIPVLQPIPFFGSWHLYIKSQNLFDNDLKMVRENGRVFGIFEGRFPVVLVSDPKLVREVLVTNFESFVDRRVFIKLENEAISSGMVFLNGSHWKHVRQTCTPAFSPANVRKMQPFIMRSINQLLTNIGRKADSGEELDIVEYAGSFTMDTISSIVFGIDLDSLNKPDNEFVVNAQEFFSEVISDIGIASAAMMFPGPVKAAVKLVPQLSRLLMMSHYFRDQIDGEIRERRQGGERAERQDFLSMLMKLEADPAKTDPNDLERDDDGSVWVRNGLTHMEVIGQAVTILLAGYETTSETFDWFCLAMATHPEYQQRLHDELSDFFASRKADDNNERLGDDVAKLPYLDMCVNETLRRYPPLFRTDRVALRDTDLGGYLIKKGVVISIPINAIQLDPEFWPNPETFDPERFSPERRDSIEPFTYLPFGLGNRMCIGMRLALLEVKLLIAHVFLNFKLTLSPRTKLPVPIHKSGFRKPRDAVWIFAERRNVPGLPLSGAAGKGIN